MSVNNEIFGIVLKCHTELKIRDYVLAIAEIVDASLITSFGKIASKYYGAFFETEEAALTVFSCSVLIINGIEIQMQLFQPTIKTIYLKGVPRVKDLTPLVTFLRQYGGLRGDFERFANKDMPEEIEHVASLTISVKLSIKDESKLPDYAKIEFCGIPFSIKIECGGKKCFHCGSRGHVANMCRRNPEAFPSIGKSRGKPLTSKTNPIAKTNAEEVIQDKENKNGNRDSEVTDKDDDVLQSIVEEDDDMNESDESDGDESNVNEVDESKTVDELEKTEDEPENGPAPPENGNDVKSDWITPRHAKKGSKRKSTTKASESASSESDISPDIVKKSAKVQSVYDESVLRKVFNGACINTDKIGNGHLTKIHLLELMVGACYSLTRVPTLAKRHATNAGLLKQQLMALSALVKNEDTKRFIHNVIESLPVKINADASQNTAIAKLLE